MTDGLNKFQYSREREWSERPCRVKIDSIMPDCDDGFTYPHEFSNSRVCICCVCVEKSARGEEIMSIDFPVRPGACMELVELGFRVKNVGKEIVAWDIVVVFF